MDEITIKLPRKTALLLNMMLESGGDRIRDMDNGENDPEMTKTLFELSVAINNADHKLLREQVTEWQARGGPHFKFTMKRTS